MGGIVPILRDLHCKTQSDFFDIIGFKQFLLSKLK